MVLCTTPASKDTSGVKAESAVDRDADTDTKQPPLGNLLQQPSPPPPPASSSSSRTMATGIEEGGLEASMAGLMLSLQEATSLRCVPFRIDYLDQSSVSSIPKVAIHYTVPPDAVDSLCARDIMACGAVFPITRNPTGGVMATAITSDPRNTALEIGKRLAVRISTGSADINPCPMS